MEALLLVSIINISHWSSGQGDLTTFDHRFSPACRVIDSKVVKCPRLSPDGGGGGGGGGEGALL